MAQASSASTTVTSANPSYLPQPEGTGRAFSPTQVSNHSLTLETALDAFLRAPSTHSIECPYRCDRIQGRGDSVAAPHFSLKGGEQDGKGKQETQQEMKRPTARIVISTFGSIGSLNPFLSLALGLRRRGHDVVFAVEENLSSAVTDAGFAVHRISGDGGKVFQEYAPKLFSGSTPIASNKIIVGKWILPNLRSKIEELRWLVADAELLVARAGHLAAPIVSDLTGIPWAQVTTTPFTIPSASIEPHPLPIKLPGPFQASANRVGWAVASAILRCMVDKTVNRIRGEYGLTPGRDFMTTGNHSQTLTALATSPAFSPNCPDWPPYVRVTGYCFPDAPKWWHEPVELTSFLRSSEPVVAVSSGSMALIVRDEFTRFYRTSIAAIRSLGLRALVIGAAPGILPDPLPKGVFALPFAPFSEVYPRCTAVIHHGGSSTTAEGLRAGIPALILPWGIDQFVNAAQVNCIGAGLRMHRRSYTPASAARALSDLVYGEYSKARTQTIAAQIAKENGVETLCDALEAVLDYSTSTISDHCVAQCAPAEEGYDEVEKNRRTYSPISRPQMIGRK